MSRSSFQIFGYFNGTLPLRVAVHVQRSPYRNGTTSYISSEVKAIPVTGLVDLIGL
jgi:hypothetical protein